MTNYDAVEDFHTLFLSVRHSVQGRQFDRKKRDNPPPISRVQWLIMRIVHDNRQCTIGDLAECLGVSASTISQMIDRLEKVGMVCRVPGQEDARVRLVQLTDKGTELYDELSARFIQMLAEPFNTLTSEEQETLLRLMKKLARAFQNR